MGNFNALHPRLQSVSATNMMGCHVVLLLDTITCILFLSTGEATHVCGRQLDPTFVSGDLLPGATWQACLRLTSDYCATLTAFAFALPGGQKVEQFIACHNLNKDVCE